MFASCLFGSNYGPLGQGTSAFITEPKKLHILLGFVTDKASVESYMVQNLEDMFSHVKFLTSIGVDPKCSNRSG